MAEEVFAHCIKQLRQQSGPDMIRAVHIDAIDSLLKAFAAYSDFSSAAFSQCRLPSIIRLESLLRSGYAGM